VALQAMMGAVRIGTAHGQYKSVRPANVSKRSETLRWVAELNLCKIEPTIGTLCV
jgi:hypothetical protein